MDLTKVRISLDEARRQLRNVALELDEAAGAEPDDNKSNQLTAVFDAVDKAAEHAEDAMRLLEKCK